MLAIDEVLKLLTTGSFPTTPFLAEWRDVYYRMSIHTTGVCPGFVNMRFSEGVKDGDSRGEPVYPFVKPYGYGGQCYDYYFDNFLLNRYPREDEKIRQWRKSQYRPFQKGAFQKVIDKIVGTIASDNNFSLKVRNKEDDDYIQGNNFNGFNLTGYVFHNFKAICEDPNGIFVTIPGQKWNETTTSKVEPKIYFINTKNILFVTPEEIVFSTFDYTWLVNNIGYFRFIQNDKNEWVNLDPTDGYYAHLMGRIPKHFAGGIWNTLGWFDSYLESGRAFADEFVATYSSAQFANKENTFPYITMAQDDCPACNGIGVMTYCRTCKNEASECRCEEKELGKGACKSCHGSGHISWNPGNVKVAPYKEMDRELIRVVYPETTINEFLAKASKEVYEGIMDSLHQQFVDEAQSGVAKEIDREGQYLFVQKVCNGIFDLIEKLLIDILSLRNTSFANGVPTATPGEYTLIKPTQFSLKTESDLLEEYQSATKANMPAFVRQRQIEEYVERVYGGDEVMKKKTCCIMIFDPLAVDTVLDKSAKKDAGAISQREYQFSVQLPNIMDSLLRAKGTEWLLTADMDSIKAAVDAAFDKIPVVKVELPAPLPSPQT